MMSYSFWPLQVFQTAISLFLVVLLWCLFILHTTISTFESFSSADDPLQFETVNFTPQQKPVNFDL